MPGPISDQALPLRLTAPFDWPVSDGAARYANGSATAAMPVVGCGVNLAWPVAAKPPTTWIAEALMTALPLPAMADAELESTITAPGTLMLALPETVRAPLALRPRI